MARKPPPRGPYTERFASVQLRRGRKPKYSRGRWWFEVEGWPKPVSDVCGAIWPPVPGRASYTPMAVAYAKEHLRLMRKHGKHLYQVERALRRTRRGEQPLYYMKYKLTQDWRKYVGIDPKDPVKIVSPTLQSLFRVH